MSNLILLLIFLNKVTIVVVDPICDITTVIVHPIYDVTTVIVHQVFTGKIYRYLFSHNRQIFAKIYR